MWSSVVATELVVTAGRLDLDAEARRGVPLTLEEGRRAVPPTVVEDEDELVLFAETIGERRRSAR